MGGQGDTGEGRGQVVNRVKWGGNLRGEMPLNRALYGANILVCGSSYRGTFLSLVLQPRYFIANSGVLFVLDLLFLLPSYSFFFFFFFFLFLFLCLFLLFFFLFFSILLHSSLSLRFLPRICLFLQSVNTFHLFVNFHDLCRDFFLFQNLLDRFSILYFNFYFYFNRSMDGWIDYSLIDYCLIDRSIDPLIFFNFYLFFFLSVCL